MKGKQKKTMKNSNSAGYVSGSLFLVALGISFSILTYELGKQSGFWGREEAQYVLAQRPGQEDLRTPAGHLEEIVPN